MISATSTGKSKVKPGQAFNLCPSINKIKVAAVCQECATLALQILLNQTYSLGNQDLQSLLNTTVIVGQYIQESNCPVQKRRGFPLGNPWGLLVIAILYYD